MINLTCSLRWWSINRTKATFRSAEILIITSTQDLKTAGSLQMQIWQTSPNRSILKASILSISRRNLSRPKALYPKKRKTSKLFSLGFWRLKMILIGLRVSISRRWTISRINFSWPSRVSRRIFISCRHSLKLRGQNLTTCFWNTNRPKRKSSKK